MKLCLVCPVRGFGCHKNGRFWVFFACFEVFCVIWCKTECCNSKCCKRNMLRQQWSLLVSQCVISVYKSVQNVTKCHIWDTLCTMGFDGPGGRFWRFWIAGDGLIGGILRGSFQGPPGEVPGGLPGGSQGSILGVILGGRFWRD